MDDGTDGWMEKTSRRPLLYKIEMESILNCSLFSVSLEKIDSSKSNSLK
jgi:hypothetical protein